MLDNFSNSLKEAERWHSSQRSAGAMSNRLNTPTCIRMAVSGIPGMVNMGLLVVAFGGQAETLTAIHWELGAREHEMGFETVTPGGMSISWLAIAWPLLRVVLRTLQRRPTPHAFLDNMLGVPVTDLRHGANYLRSRVLRSALGVGERRDALTLLKSLQRLSVAHGELRHFSRSRLVLLAQQTTALVHRVVNVDSGEVD